VKFIDEHSVSKMPNLLCMEGGASGDEKALSAFSRYWISFVSHPLMFTDRKTKQQKCSLHGSSVCLWPC